MADLLVLNPADTVAILTERGVAPAGHKIARAGGGGGDASLAELDEAMTAKA